MWPKNIIILDTFPLTQSGKVNRAVLEKMPVKINLPVKSETTLTPVEEALAKIWVDLLRVTNVDKRDNFFALGGDSILSIQMVSRAKKVGLKLTVKEVFIAPTLCELAKLAKQESINVSNKVNSESGDVPLLPIQQWFFENSKNIHHFNQARWLVKIDQKCIIEMSKLEKILKSICMRHKAFYLKYKKESNQWRQYYSASCTFNFEVIEQSNWTYNNLASVCTEIQESLNIETGPLYKIVWFDGLGLFWVIHHLIIDGVSWRILLDDMNDLYNQMPITPTTDSYKAWSQYLRSFDQLEETERYYQFEPPCEMNIPLTNNRCSYKISLSKSATHHFIHHAHSAYNTKPNDLLLAALVMSFAHETDGVLLVDIEGHGRESLDTALDMTHTVGWFTIMYPVNLHITSMSNLPACIQEIKEQLRKIPENGIGYGISRYIKKDISDMSVPISFNYMGQWDAGTNNNTVFKFGDHVVGQCLSKNRTLLHNLDILAEVCNEQLTFYWESYYSEDILQNIANNYVCILTSLIEHTIGISETTYTPSDFSMSDLTQDDLAEILNS